MQKANQASIRKSMAISELRHSDSAVSLRKDRAESYQCGELSCAFGAGANAKAAMTRVVDATT